MCTGLSKWRNRQKDWSRGVGCHSRKHKVNGKGERLGLTNWEESVEDKTWGDRVELDSLETDGSSAWVLESVPAELKS